MPSTTTELREACTYMEQANIQLVNSRIENALRIYTRILEKVSPGHPAAFLNRSCAYLMLGQYDLAAMDAYRAYIGAKHAKGYRGSTQGMQIRTYIAKCVDATDPEQPWCTEPTCFIQLELMDTELGKLSTFTRISEPKRQGKAGRLFSYIDMTMKAQYRLAWALWKAGGGAILSAMDVLEHANNHGAWEFDREQNTRLCNRVLVDVEEVYKAEDRARAVEVTDSVRTDTRDFDKLMGTKYVPRSATTVGHDFVRQMTARSTEGLYDCLVTMDGYNLVALENRRDTGGGYVMIAEDDIFAGDCLFTEKTPLTVFTQSVRKNEALICSNCGADLVAPKDLLYQLYLQKDPESATAGHTAARPSTPPELSGLDVDEYLIDPDLPAVQGHGRTASTERDKSTHQSGTQSAVPPLPPPHRVLPSQSTQPRHLSGPLDHDNHDLQLCRGCNGEQIFCSPQCQGMSQQSHHFKSCNHTIEQNLRHNYLDKTHHEAPDVHIRIILVLMLTRLLSWANARNTPPKEMAVVKLLAAGYANLQSPLSDEQERNMAWSFDSHVALPIEILKHLGRMSGFTGTVMNTLLSDGKVINTLMSLTAQHMQISTHGRWTNTYNEYGILSDVKSKDTPAAAADIPATDTDDGKIGSYIARLHPLCCLLETASDPADANVELVDIGNATVVCIPLAKSSSTSTPGSDDTSTSASFNNAYSHLNLSSQPASPLRLPDQDEVHIPVITAGAPLRLASKNIRCATHDERILFQKGVAARAENDSMASMQGSRDTISISSGDEHVENLLAASMRADEEQSDIKDEGDGGVGVVEEGEIVESDMEDNKMAEGEMEEGEIAEGGIEGGVTVEEGRDEEMNDAANDSDPMEGYEDQGSGDDDLMADMLMDTEEG